MKKSDSHTHSLASQPTQLIGQSNAIQRVHELIHRIGPIDETVLLEGETGTGKDLIAHLIHQASMRRDQSFVSVNCAALPSTLVESELFGYAKGTFTGASRARKGLVQQAEGGTLYLDEIGEMPLDLQAKLLRVIDTKIVLPLGGIETLVDVRIIAASNRDLKTAVCSGVFRADLFYRLNTIPVHLPPLRERRTDIPLLIDYFLKEFTADFQRSIELKADVYSLLKEYAWPGNVRELKSLLKRVFLMTEQSQLNAIDVAPYLDDETEMGEGTLLPLRDVLARCERQYLCYALERANGNKAEASRILDVDERTFYRRLAKYNL